MIYSDFVSLVVKNRMPKFMLLLPMLSTPLKIVYCVVKRK